jgi:hypothetical protein
MKTILPREREPMTRFPGSCLPLRALTLAVAGLLTLSTHGEFVPGSGGSVPDIAPLQGVPNQIAGLMVVKSDRENNPFGGGTRSILDLKFPPPSVHGASGYILQRSPGILSVWESALDTVSNDQDLFSFSPEGIYSYRLLVQGGEKNGFISNVVTDTGSNLDTRFSSWGLDESMSISGVMSPWVGRGLAASVRVHALSDNSEVTGGLRYQWYRINPLSGAMIEIGGANNPTYITTQNDLGGYHHLCRATGNRLTTGGFIQVMSSGGVLVPNNSYSSGLTANGFFLNLHKSIPSLIPTDLDLRYWDGAEQKNVAITGVTASEGNATFWVAATLPTGVTTLTLDNKSAVWSLGSETAPGRFMQSLQITVPAEGFAPEMDVERSNGAALTDGGGSQGFGKVLVGKTGEATTFTILNTGTSNLTGLVISKDGTNAADFQVSAPSAGSVAPGGTATFTVTFKPGAAGARTCAIHIASNDADENPFDIALGGTGVAPAPEIVVQEPKGKSLVDNKNNRNYGIVKMGGKGRSKVFTIKNTGTAVLEGIAVKVGGTHAKDFTVLAPSKTQLAPGTSTTFRVTFKPRAKGNRKAALKIRSNDADENPFDVVLTGRGSK